MINKVNNISLVLPFLDYEFQKITKTNSLIVDQYTRISLLVSDKIITSPSFFVESRSTRESILLSDYFFGLDNIYFSIKENSFETFLTKKQQQYQDLKDIYFNYYTLPDSFIEDVKIKIRKRRYEIGKSIANKWIASTVSLSPLSINHMADFYSDGEFRADLLSKLMLIPAELSDKPFVWENVEKSLDKEFRDRWRNLDFINSLRLFLLKLYFDSFAEKNDYITSFNDFPTLGITDNSLSHNTISLKPLLKFLKVVNKLEDFISLPLPNLVELINKQDMKYFRTYYISLHQQIAETEIFNSLMVTYQRERNYKDEIKRIKKNNNIIINIFNRFVNIKFDTKKKLSLDDSFKRLSISNFIGYLNDYYTQNKKKLMEEEKQNGDTYNIHGGQIGAVGKNAHADNPKFYNNYTGEEHLILLSEVRQIRQYLLDVENVPPDDKKNESLDFIEKNIKEYKYEFVREAAINAGSWIYTIAEKLGLTLLAKLIIQ